MKKNLLYFVGGIVILVAVWTAFYLTVQNDYVVPSPISALAKTFVLFTEGYFYAALFSTLLRVLIAFLISLVLSVITGVLSYKFQAVSGVFSVITGALRSLPTLAVLLIILVSVTRSYAPVVVCFITLFPMLHTAIYSALKRVDDDVVEMLKVYGVPLKKQIFNAYIPTVFPPLLAEFSTALSFAIKLTVSAEILANVYGSMGGLLQQSSLYSNTEMLFALTIAVCIVGIIIEFIGKITSDMLDGRKR